jgi:putative flippase GtrA
MTGSIGAGRVQRVLRAFAAEGMRMALLSVFSLGLGYVLTLAMTTGLKLRPETAYSIAIVLCSVINFFGCRHYVFRGPSGGLWREAARFFPSVLVFRAFEIALFSGIHSLWGNYHLAYFATAAISMVAKLLVSKLFIFKRPTV